MTRLIAQAKAGDSSLQSIFAHAGTTLGIAIANMINIFDPTKILIGGEGLRAGDLILKPLYTTLPEHIFGPSRGDINLVVNPMEESYWARGAASLILREVFQPPIYENDEALAIDDLLLQASAQQRRKE